MRDDHKPFMGLTLDQWLPWLAATAVASASMSYTAAMVFQTKDDAKNELGMQNEKLKEHKDNMEKRLDRIELKIDKLQDSITFKR